MRKLYIHIGMPKTATTHLQVRQNHTEEESLTPFFRSLSEYPDLGSHEMRVHILPQLLKMEAPDIVDDVLSRFCDWYDSGPNQTRLYCSEMLCQTPGFHKDRMHQVFERLNRQFEVHWIVVLRPYFSWMESFINQTTKTGFVRFDLLLTDPKKAFASWQINYANLFEDYAPHILGEERLHVFHYGPDVNDKILDLTQLKFSPAIDVGRNKSPSPVAALQRFLKQKGLSLRYLPDNRSLRFVATNEVMKWAPEMQAWAHPLAKRLGWPLHWIDDSAQVLARRERNSLLTHVIRFPELLKVR